MVAILTGCRSSAFDPAAVFQDIRSDFQHGDLVAAQQKVEQARKDFSTSGADWPMKFRLLDAEILIYRGHRPEALALLVDPGVSYPIAGDLAIKKNLLCGMAHATLDQAQQSQRELQEAQRLSDESHSELSGEVLRTDAVIQLIHDHLPEAADLSRRSLKVAHDERDRFLQASDLQNLGLIAVEMGHYDEALALLDEAADAARPIQARVILSFVLGNRGVAYFYLGDFEKALLDFRQAEQEAMSTGTASAEVDWLMDAASSYYMLGDLQEAKICFEQALKPAEALKAPTEIADIETHLAFLLYRQGQIDSAKNHIKTGMNAAIMSGDKTRELEPLYLQALLANQELSGQDPERMLFGVYEKSTGSPALRGQIENGLAKLYSGRHQLKPANLWYRRSIQTFEDQRAEVSDEELKLPFFANGEALYQDYADFLIACKKQEEALQLLDLGRAKTLAEGLGSTKQLSREQQGKGVDVQAVARKVDGAILFYSLAEEKSYLWVVTAHHTQLFLLPGKAAIAVQVQRYQKAILKSSDPLRDVNENAKTLFDTLVSPAVAMLPRGSRVFIIADGILNSLNFETLLTTEGDGPHYWIEDVTISNANSIRMLSMFDTGAPLGAKKKLLLIGNPIVTGTGYENLLNAFAEIRGLEKHFQSSDRTVITQSEAIPAAYANSKPEQYSYIHFVAHGTASELSPLDSAVVLSPPPGNPDDFKLYAREIMRSPLHARLVTISACYGSGSRAYAGEGLVGLSWAFLRAGSHNVIGALWEVNDAATPLLMDRLYGAIEAGRAPDAALREAKLSLIHSSAVYRKPFYWGGFQLYAGS